MSITQSESGLTSPQYSAFQSQDNKTAYRLTAHRYNLNFAEHSVSPALPAGEVSIFDSCEHQGYIAVVAAADVYAYDETDTSGDPAELPGFDIQTIPSIVPNGTNNVSVFTIQGGGITQHNVQININPLLVSDSTLIHTEANITHIAAVSAERIHYVAFLPTERVYQLKCLQWTGSAWESIASNTYLSYAVQSFDAETLNGKDIIALMTQTPGNVAVKAVGVEVKRYIEPSGGVMVFTYKYESWSDHFEVDILDNVTDYRFRRCVRLSVWNGQAFLTAYGVDGTQNSPFASYRFYTSKDGRFWSLGKILPTTDGMTGRGMKLVKRGDFLYGVQFSRMERSYATMEVGHTPAALAADITNDVKEYSLTRDTIVSCSLVLDNGSGAYYNHAVLNKESRVALVHEFGFYLTPGSPATFITVAITEVDYLDWSDEPAERLVKIQSRDRLALMTDYTESEEAHYRENQLTGGDDYVDETKTNYGGLRHTATQEGAWQTENGELTLRSSNKEGSAFSTFSTYVWNGSFQTDFVLSTLGNNEFAGIVYRAVDKNNLYYVAYDDASDRIRLFKRLNNTSTQVAQSAVKVWTNLQRHWLRVEFRYAQVKVYSSNDGITWSLEITYLQPGQHEVGTVGPMMMDRGYVGHLGKGFAPEQTWTFPQYEFEPIYYIPPDFDFNFDFDFADGFEVEIPGETGGKNNVAIAWSTAGLLALTESLTSSSPIWRGVALPAGLVRFACIDKSSEYVTSLGLTGGLGVYVIVADGDFARVYYTEDILVDEPEFDELYSKESDDPVRGAVIRQGLNSLSRVAVCWHSDSTCYIAYSEDAGEDWEENNYGSSSGGADDVYMELMNLNDDMVFSYGTFLLAYSRRPDLTDSGNIVFPSDTFDITSQPIFSRGRHGATTNELYVLLRRSYTGGYKNIEMDIPTWGNPTTGPEYEAEMTGFGAPGGTSANIYYDGNGGAGWDLVQRGLGNSYLMQARFDLQRPRPIDDVYVPNGSFTLWYSSSSFPLRGTIYSWHRFTTVDGIIYNVEWTSTDDPLNDGGMFINGTNSPGSVYPPAGAVIKTIEYGYTVDVTEITPGLTYAQLVLNGINWHVDPEHELLRLDDYDASFSGVWTHISPDEGGFTYGRGIHMATHPRRGSESSFVVLHDRPSYINGSPRIGQYSGGGVGYTLSFTSNRIYRRVYMNPQGRTFALGDNLFRSFRPIDGNRKGNLDDLWTDTWSARGMESL